MDPGRPRPGLTPLPGRIQWRGGPEYSPEETMARIVPGDRDKGLVLAARRGDEEAFREIYRTYREPVWSVILSLIGDPLQAQDILQTVFFKAFRGLAGFRFRSCPVHLDLPDRLQRMPEPPAPARRPRGAARGHPRQPLRSRRRRTAPTDLGPARTRLKSAVLALPFKMREVVVLKYQEDLSYEEMSRVLGCPPGTIASRLNRALAELESQMRRIEGCP